MSRMLYVCSFDKVASSSFDDEGRFEPNLQNAKRKTSIAITFDANANDLVGFELSIKVLIVYCGRTRVTKTHMTVRFNFQYTLLADSVSKSMISHNRRKNRLAPAANLRMCVNECHAS